MATREFTDQELAGFAQLDKTLFDRGVDMYGQNGNADVFVEYFNANRNIPALLPNFQAAVDLLRDRLVWRSPIWKEWDSITKQNPKVAVAVANWLLGGAQTQHVPEVGVVANTVANALAIAKEVLRYGNRNITTDSDLLWKIVAALPQLEKAETKKTVDTNYRPGRLFEKGEANRTYAEAVRQSHPQELQQTGPTAEQTLETEAEKQCVAISRNGTWSDRSELETVMARERKNGSNWTQTLAAMETVQRERRHSRYRGEAAGR